MKEGESFRLLDGFLVIAFPDKVFPRVLANDRIQVDFFAVYLTFQFLFVVSINLFRLINLPSLYPPLGWIVLASLGIFLLSLNLVAGASFILNWLYSNAITVKGRNLEAGFRSSFLCRVYLLPYWLFSMFILAAFSSLVWRVAGFLLVLILLHAEARMMRILYKVGARQAYVLIATQTVVILIGMAGAWLCGSRLAISL